VLLSESILSQVLDEDQPVSLGHPVWLDVPTVIILPTARRLGGKDSVKALYWIALMFCFTAFVVLVKPSVTRAGGSSILLAQQKTEAAGAQVGAKKDESKDEYDEEEEEEEKPEVTIPDPFEGMNRGLYHFNDKMYFWVLKPAAQGYKFIVPQEIRTCVLNFFDNIRFPVRFINCLLQGKWAKAQGEFCRFFLNSTVGFAGIGNVAQHYPSLNLSPEDLGQTFGVWGFDTGAYLMLPFLGPSSFRDGLGRAGDTVMDPIFWVPGGILVGLEIRAGETVNSTSLRIGDYEALKQAAFDPYIAIRNAYVQNRRKMIQE
jgi:phospholipid-binding lipoprotein MlaA